MVRLRSAKPYISSYFFNFVYHTKLYKKILIRIAYGLNTAYLMVSHLQYIVSFEYLTSLQWWANLDQASKDLDKTIFRDLSPTPIP